MTLTNHVYGNSKSFQKDMNLESQIKWGREGFWFSYVCVEYIQILALHWQHHQDCSGNEMRGFGKAGVLSGKPV